MGTRGRDRGTAVGPRPGARRAGAAALVGLLALGCGGAAPEGRAPGAQDGPGASAPAAGGETRCLAQHRATAGRALAPLVAALGEGRVVFRGEHHGDPAELATLVALVQAVRSAGHPLDVAFELLPVAGAPALAALQAGGDPAGWMDVVAARYHPDPLQHAAYRDAVLALIAAGATVHPLAPDCGLPPGPAVPPAAVDAALACFAGRDAAMADRLVALRQPGRGLLVSLGFWHAAQARPGGDPSLAPLLEAALDEDMVQVVMAGAEGPDPAGPAGAPGTCAGLGRRLQEEGAGRPWLAALDQGPWRALPAACVAEGATVGVDRLGALFEWLLVPAAPAAAPTALLPAAAWSQVPIDRFRRWDSLQSELMGQAPVGAAPARWAAWLADRAARRDAVVALPPDDCAPLLRLGLPADGGGTAAPPSKPALQSGK